MSGAARPAGEFATSVAKMDAEGGCEMTKATPCLEMGTSAKIACGSYS